LTTKTIYQTLDDKGDPDHVENHGPFICNRKNAWLGEGYYFWESYLNNAHWWGSSYKNRYIICEAKIESSELICFDILDNPVHIKQLQDAALLLEEKGTPSHQMTIGNLIQFLRNNMMSFTYQAVRAKGEGVRSMKNVYTKSLLFRSGHTAYVDLNPPIQVCLFTKRSLGFRDFRIIFPEEYVIDDYVV
jgi:hypothetical protein